MLVIYELNPETKLTSEQRKMLEGSAKRPIVFDEDCPPLTDDELKRMRRVNSTHKKAE